MPQQSITSRIARRFMRRQLHRTLRHEALDVLDDFILPGAYDGLTYIHFAVLTRAGIVCVLAKHCRGAVEGRPDDPQWYQGGNGGRRQFLNPLIQNAGHVEALSRIVPDVPVLGLVVLSGAASVAAHTDDRIVPASSVGARIRALNSGEGDIARLQEAWHVLQASALTDAATRKDLDAQLSFG